MLDDKTLGVYIFFLNPSKCKYTWVVKNFIEYIMLYILWYQFKWKIWIYLWIFVIKMHTSVNSHVLDIFLWMLDFVF